MAVSERSNWQFFIGNAKYSVHNAFEFMALISHHTRNTQIQKLLLYCLQLTKLEIYTVSQKNIPDIFDCNLKNYYQILIILVQIFLTQLAIKRPFSFPPHPMYASALPRESRSSKICVRRNRKPEKNIPNIIDHTLTKD